MNYSYRKSKSWTVLIWKIYLDMRRQSQPGVVDPAGDNNGAANTQPTVSNPALQVFLIPLNH